MRLLSSTSSVRIPSWAPRLPRFRVLPKRPLSEWALFAAILIYIAICVYVYFTWVEPWIAGQIYTRIGADSDTYWGTVKLVQSGLETHPLIAFDTNQLGPVALGLILKNGFAILCFNVFIFFLSLRIAFSIPGINKGLFGFLMLANIELLPTLATLNKEILTLIAAILIAKYIYSDRRGKLLFVAICLACLLARWEQLFIFIVFLVLYRFGHHRLTLVAMILAITVTYPMMIRFVPALGDFTFAGSGGHTITFLNTIQAHFGFPLVLIPKMLMTSVGTLGSPWFYWSGAFLAQIYDIQQIFFQPLGCAAFVIVGIWAFAKGKLNLDRPIIFLAAIQMISVAVTPFVQPRYIFAIYIFLCLEVALPEVGTVGEVGSPAHYLQAARSGA